MRRSWRRFHLGTALAVMLMAAVLLWLNARRVCRLETALVFAQYRRPVIVEGTVPAKRLPKDVHLYDFSLGAEYRVTWGWPFRAYGFQLFGRPAEHATRPIEIPEAWRVEALRNGQSRQVFYVDPDYAARLFPSHARGLRSWDCSSAYRANAYDRVWEAYGVTGNALVAAAILVVVGIFVEWLQRRRSPGD